MNHNLFNILEARQGTQSSDVYDLHYSTKSIKVDGCDKHSPSESGKITLEQPCRRCGGDKAFIKPTAPSSPHKAGLWCADCDSWIKWVGKNQVSLLVLESLGKGLQQGGEG